MPVGNNDTESTRVKPYTSKELAALYGVSMRTLRAWLQPHLESIGRKVSIYYTTRQVSIIFEKIGEPG